MATDEELLRAAYAAFNHRDPEAAIELMHPEVDWPNAWEGGRLRGRAAVRDYWRRQFAAVCSRVDPERISRQPDGTVVVDVRQVVRDARTDRMLAEERVRHVYRLEDGLIRRMDVVDRGAGPGPPS